MRRLVLTIAMVLLPGVVSAQSAEDKRMAADIDSMIRRVIALTGTPGLSVAVVRGEHPILVEGYGFADIERRERATAFTAFLCMASALLEEVGGRGAVGRLRRTGDGPADRAPGVGG